MAAVTAVAAVMTATIARDADLSVKMSVNAVLNAVLKFEFYASPDVGAEGAVHYPVPEVLWRAHLKPV